MVKKDELAERRANLSTAQRAALEERLQRRRQPDAQGRIPRRPTGVAIPLSYTQQRLWLMEQLMPHNPAYHISVPLRLSGQLLPEVLEQSLALLQERHEVLRTVFELVEGEPVQRVQAAARVPLRQLELRSLARPAQEREVHRLAQEEAQRPFDLTCGPLWRVLLLHLSDSEHILLLTMHHIISDGWSMGILLRELTSLYQTLLNRGTTTLPELPIQYGDFALWQRNWLDGERLARQLSYWQEVLQGPLPVLELPTDYARPPVQSFRGRSHVFHLSAEVTVALKALAQAEGATLFMVLLAAFQTLLARYSGQRDIIVGSAVANRSRLETEGLIGFFVNTLVLRTSLAGGPSFREVLRRVREVTLGAYAHQDVPFEKLVEVLQPTRTLGRSPLFQVMFVLQSPPTLNSLPGLIIEPLLVHSGTAMYDLTLEMSEGSSGLYGHFDYCSDLFAPATIERFCRHFEQLLTIVVAQPHLSIDTLPLLSPAERNQILTTWNGTERAYPATATIISQFEAQVARSPEAIAVSTEDGCLRYAELNARANQLAHHLRRLGVGPEKGVVLHTQRNLSMLIGLLGILKAGGAYIPLDPQLPSQRISFIVEDTQPVAILTERMLSATLPPGIPCLPLDAPEAAFWQERSDAPDPLTEPAHLAYVIYTSGSTGVPKGVCCSHLSVINLLEDFKHRWPRVVGERASLWTNLSFDVSIFEIFSTLLTGGELHLVPEAIRADAPRLLAWLSKKQIHTAYLPPFILAALEEALASHPERYALRRLLVGVEPIEETLLASIQCRLPGLELLNGYGPTETTVCVTLYPVAGPPPYPRRTPIGRPMQNTQLYLLDRFLQPVPVGVWGEIYIGGVGLARGYLRRPDLSAERFVPHPFASRPGERLYRTGDLARYHPDGNIEFLGRIDHQIKLHGYRIELGEIEALLHSHSDVQESAVLLRTVRGEAQLVAYVVPGPGAALDATTLRLHLKRSLPPYMVPAHFVFLEALPRTSGGKLDRQSLPEPGEIGEGKSDFVAPRTALEEAVAAEWAVVLKQDRIGVLDNFFELGGHSLIATQLLARLQQQFEVELSMRDLFESPTVEGVAACIARAKEGDSYPLLPETPLFNDEYL